MALKQSETQVRHAYRVDRPRSNRARFETTSGAILAPWLLAAPLFGAAQEPPPQVCAADARPSIGIALSGGGAHGGAHIGVLKALEELRVPIDCVAGTSFGAAIGGFYAAGLTAAEIEEVARGIDWSGALWNTTPRRDRSLRRKSEDHLFLVNVRPGLQDGKFAFPTGLLQGQLVDTVLARSTVGAYEVDDFDRLTLPFRAVATDLATAEAVLLRSGNLALALRASMSLPAVFAPVDIDGQMLVDGGLAMNLPVQAAQSMGADIVIAVDVTTPLLGRDRMRSVIDVTNQLTTLLLYPGTQQQRALLDDNDILLAPSFGPESTFMTFALLPDLIDNGYDAVMRERERFAPLALDAERYAAHVASRPKVRATELPVIEFVRLDNQSRIANSLIAARLEDLPIGVPLDLDAVEAATSHAYGLGWFQSVRYEVVDDETGATGIEIDVTERSWGPNYAQIGLHYASASDADTQFGIALSYLRTGVNAHGGEWRSTLVLGDEPGLHVDRYQPLGAEGRAFFQPRVDLQTTRLNVYDGERIAAEVKVRESLLELAAGRELHSDVEIRFGVRGGSGRYRLHAGEVAAVPGNRFRRGEVFARFSVDTLDSVAFPRAGLLSTLEWRSSREALSSADEEFDQLSAHAAFAKTWRRNTLLSTLRYDATTSGVAPLHSQFQMGGFLDLSGLRFEELTGQHAARLGASYYRHIGDSVLLPMFAGFSVEVGNTWNERSAIGRREAVESVSIWVGVGTPLGPLYLGAGRTDEGRDSLYLALGSVF
jgi:NTE family protein